MDDSTFNNIVTQCKSVNEATTCLEMFSYSDPSLSSVDQHPLTLDDFNNFLHRQGAWAPAILPNEVHLVAGVRLILQVNARHPETFKPGYISLQHEAYMAMIEALHLPPMAIETSSIVGPFFWCELDRDDENPHLQMVFRKSDVRKRGTTRGWELILSHEFRTGITTGFYKGTPSSHIRECLNHLRACGSELGHAMLLPAIIVGHESSSRADVIQRDARDWLCRLEQAISMRKEINEDEGYGKDGLMDLDAINRDLVECQAQVLWKRPVAYLSIIDSIEEAAQIFMQMLPDERKSPAIQNFQRTITSRLKLYRKRWVGIDTYANTTMQRLEIQRSALYNVIAQKESRLNLQIAADQRKLAHTSKRQSEAMKGISLLGTIFLPGAFLASIFSTTFFDFQDAPDLASVVSPRFWLYWAVTVPFTLLIVALYFVWERRRVRLYEKEDQDLEQDLENIETSIIRTMTKAHTKGPVMAWDKRNKRKTQLAADEENDYGAFKDPTNAVSSNTLGIPQSSI